MPELNGSVLSIVPAMPYARGMTHDVSGGPILLAKHRLVISIVVAQMKRVSNFLPCPKFILTVSGRSFLVLFFLSRLSCRSHFGRNSPPSALFEESLARHGVGSYHPGEMVRMDPALRNPLLKLLETRFGYVDGDFERDPNTGLWVEGEGADLWETILPSGKPPVSGGRKRGDTK
jgi:hypothetical protein